MAADWAAIKRGGKATTEVYAGLDISDKTTHICAVGKDGRVIWRGVCVTDPEALASNLTKHCPGLVRVVFETGPLSSFSITAWWSGACLWSASAPFTTAPGSSLNISEPSQHPMLAKPSDSGKLPLCAHVDGQSLQLNRTKRGNL